MLTVRTWVRIPGTHEKPDTARGEGDMAGGMCLWPGSPAVTQKAETGIT